VPIGAWLDARAKRLAPPLAADEAVAELVPPGAVAALFRSPLGKRQAFAAWTLLFYALWYRRHVRGQRADGDVFETLGAR